MARSRHKHVARIRSARRRRLTRMGLAASAVLAAAPPVAAVVWPDDVAPGSTPLAGATSSQGSPSPWPMRATPHSEAPALLEAQALARPTQAAQGRAAKSSGERRGRQADVRATRKGGHDGGRADDRSLPVAEPGASGSPGSLPTAAATPSSTARATRAAGAESSPVTPSAPTAAPSSPSDTASPTQQGTAAEGPTPAWDDPMGDADLATLEPTPAPEPTAAYEPTPYSTGSPEVCVGVGPGRVTPQKLARAGCATLPY